MVLLLLDNLAMAAMMESFIATQKFARVLGDETDPTELMVMSDAMSVKKRRRSCFPCGSTGHVLEKEKLTADGDKEKPTADEEGDGESEDSDADPWHKLSEKKEKEKKPVW